MEKLSVLGTESVIIVSLMAATSVFLIGKVLVVVSWTFITIYLFPATIVFLYLGIKVKNI